VSRGARLGLLVLGLSGLAVLLVAALLKAPSGGREQHPYGDAAIAASVSLRHTPNVVSSLTFDQRGFDTLGEEFLLFASVLGAVVLLRPEPGERSGPVSDAPEPLDAVRLMGALLLPVVTLVGLYLIGHGHLSPGGGFQGGVVLATALHLLYIAGDYPALRRVRPVPVVDVGEAVAAVGYVAIGVVGLVSGGAFLANTLPLGSFNTLLSAGTVGLLNVVVGLEVACGMVLLLGEFLEQALVVRERAES